MNAINFNSLHNVNWREFYQAAIFELDTCRLPHRITEAEQAIVRRVTDLVDEPGDHIKERRALENAMHTLKALRGTLKGPMQNQAA